VNLRKYAEKAGLSKAGLSYFPIGRFGVLRSFSRFGSLRRDEQGAVLAPLEKRLFFSVAGTTKDESFLTGQAKKIEKILFFI
jgi:hypothetical protein